MATEVLFSKKLAFSAENILNPQTNDVLFETSVPKSAYNLPGHLEFTVVAIKLKPTQKQKLNRFSGRYPRTIRMFVKAIFRFSG